MKLEIIPAPWVSFDKFFDNDLILQTLIELLIVLLLYL